MTNKLVMAFLCIGCLAVPETVASAAPKESAYEICMDKFVTNTDADQCGGAEIGRQEARLNRAWKKVLACFSGPENQNYKKAFIEEQRAWIRWKDAACSFYLSGYEGREGEAIAYPVCKAKVIQERSQTLEKFASGTHDGPKCY